MKQYRAPHPLGFYVWHRYAFTQRLREAWWCLTGVWSLHRAWQRGYDQHIIDHNMLRARENATDGKPST